MQNDGSFPMKELMYSSFSDDREILRQRLMWLTGIRWYAAASIVPAALIGRYVLEMRFPVWALLLIALGMAIYNAYYAAKVKRPEFNPGIALQQIILDVLALSLILFFTGGFINPFFTFYFFIVIIARIILSHRQSLLIAVLVTLSFVIQGLASSVVPVDMKVSGDSILHLGEVSFHVIGAPISFVLTTIITAYFVSVIMGDLQKREREVRSARMQAELELNKLDNILRHLETGMLVIDNQGKVEWVNDCVVNWFGTEGKDETKACYLISRIAKRYLHTSLDVESSESGKSHFFEVRLPTVTQGMRDFEVLLSSIRGPGGELVQVIELILDVTEQKKNQEQWARAQKLAAIGQLAAGIAHELNTPLGTISILAEEARDIIQTTIPKEECDHAEELDESLQTIHDQIKRCKEITQGLLNFSRKPENIQEFCSINELVHQAIDLLGPKLSKVTLHERLDDSLPMIITESSGIQRAVFNILLNAADAVENNEVEKKIEVETCKQDGMIGIRIRDNGCGIAKPDIPHLYEPFFTTKPVGKGTGLGLYVTYGTIQDLGGRLEIESELGEGTQVEIWLPIRTEEEQ